MIAAVVLAAGLSSRMGQAKPLLTWGQRTVIEHLQSILLECPVDEILVITGHEREAVERHLVPGPVRAVFNPHYAAGEMLSSIQVGLSSTMADAALIVLGDQPALERSVVARIVAAYQEGRGDIVIPSYHRRRGHPLLIGHRHRAEILALGQGQTLRDYFRGIGPEIHHVEVATPSVLRDMDTPADYERELTDYLGRRRAVQDTMEV